jgi:hypothetical protein
MTYNYNMQSVDQLANLPCSEMGARLDRAVNSVSLLGGVNKNNLNTAPANDMFQSARDGQKKSEKKGLLIALGTAAVAITGYLLLKKKLPGMDILKEAWGKISKKNTRQVAEKIKIKRSLRPKNIKASKEVISQTLINPQPIQKLKGYTVNISSPEKILAEEQKLLVSSKAPLRLTDESKKLLLPAPPEQLLLTHQPNEIPKILRWTLPKN